MALNLLPVLIGGKNMDKTEMLIRKKFREYYEKNFVKGPSNISSREFGFGGWDKKIESRHFSFLNEKELNGYLARNAPLYISYSAAQYRYPTAPMDKKEWICAELIFDIDANEVGSECTKIHGKNWVCEKCMEKTKEAAQRLIEEFLIKDFGVKKEEIEVNFSGNRGYHIHLTAGFENLGGYARREIADYINGKGLKYEDLFVESKESKRTIGPKPTDGGWKGKIANIFIEKIKQHDLESIGVHPKIANKFYSQSTIRDIENGNWNRVYISNRKKFFENILEKINKTYSGNIDEQVTMDTTKLIRLPDSIHGETGMVAKRIKNLDKFEPFEDPVVFGDNFMEVYVKNTPKITLKNQTFGPFKDQLVGLPEYAAIYLLCKKVAELR